MASILGILPDDCFVLRDSNRTQLAAVDLVPGDILYIKSGNKLPADVLFFYVSSGAKFDRSILTGEPQPVPGAIDCTDKNYLETDNIGMQVSRFSEVISPFRTVSWVKELCELLPKDISRVQSFSNS
jgi:sodium/potassium-transporting ATPase subunit alpha